MDRRYFVFRINYDDAHSWVVVELLNKGFLRQGWGHSGLELLNKSAKLVEKENWINSFRNIWDETYEKSSLRYDILARMLGMQPADIVVIPKTTDDYSLTICQVKEGYSFDTTNTTMWDDFKHLIRVENMKTFKYDECSEAKLISSKFRAYQSAVNNVWSE
ncbi:MAG TPA: hypothetical protein VGA95_01305 [Thermodesulfobacteriota bacterium]